MDEHTPPPPVFTTPPPFFKDWQWLILLFAVVIPLRVWLLCNTEVAARDSIGYIRYALRFEAASWVEVARTFDQHPGYPLAIWAVSAPVRALAGTTDADVMVLSAQLVSALAAVLLVVPTYWFGKTVWNARVGFGGALFFQCLPISGQHLSDGVSESLFMLFLAWALLLGVWAVNGGGRRHYAGCGVFAGLAYLTRPEGLLILAATGLVLAGSQAWPRRRLGWREFVLRTTCLALPAVVVAAPYVWAIRGLSKKTSVEKMAPMVAETCPNPCGIHGAPDARVTQPPGLWANLLAASYRPVNSLHDRLLRSLGAFAAEATYGLHYFGAVLVLVPLAVYGRALFLRPGDWLILTYLVLHASILVWLALTVHYVSDRHMLPIVLVLSYLAALGCFELVERGWTWVQARRGGSAPQAAGLMKASLALLLVAIATTCLPRTVQRLHDNRAGHHVAGLWLQGRLQPGDMVDDDHAWSHFYAGQVFLEHNDPLVPAEYRPLCYVVRTRSRDAEIGAKREAYEKRLRHKGTLVYHWPENRTVEEARVVIYAVPRDGRRFPWRVASAN